MRYRAALAVTVVVSLAWAVCATSASASFGPIEIQSVNSLEQAESASEPAISADGRYLAFRGVIEGREGIFRKDLQTGAIELVAGGSIYEPEPEAPTEASAPSISADGRYVSFTSQNFLVPGVDAEGNVYVRDMDVPLPSGGTGYCSKEEAERLNGKACAYELASALNGKTEGIEISGRVGAVASGRVALSADGREVAFVIDGASDLASHNPRELTTEPGQVVVRNLDSHETILVSAEREPDGRMTEAPVKEGAVTAQRLPGARGALPGAAISADGSTVAWLGAHIPAQAPTLSDEREQIEHDDRNAESGEAYDEPLWRRIDERPLPPTRRIVGGGDPLAPGCPPDGSLAMPACQGPFPKLLSDARGGTGFHMGWLSVEGYDGVPQLSADGWTVALVGDPRPADAPLGDEGGASNVFVVNMHEGLDRVQALRQLTREVPAFNKANPGTSPEYVPSAGDVYDVGISPDGQRIAFTTQRQLFPLAPPNFVEPPLAQLGVSELYQIDLGAESLQRVTHGPKDGPSLEGSHPGIVTSRGASSPSYTADDQTLAFADTASNLVAGDANEASDVFTVTNVAPPYGSVGAVEIGPGQPSQEPARPQWRLSVVPVAHADGSVTLDVVVPGAGRVAAGATAAVPVTVAARRARKSAKDNLSVARSKRMKHVVVLKTRTVAAAQMSTALPGLLELPLRVTASYRGLLSTKAGIYARVRVSFSGPGGPRLSQSVVVTLRRATSATDNRPRATVKRSMSRGGRR